MAYFLSPLGNTQTIDANGDPLVGGTISTFLAGTSTAETTYTDDTGGTPQGVVMTLNSLGYPTNGPVWMLGGVPLKFIIKNALGVTQSTFDDISGIGDTETTADQWILYGAAPTYISATSFSVVGDQTNTFQVGRRLKSTNAGGTIYSSITASVFLAGVTTVTVVNDSGVLDADLSAVSYGLLSSVNPSVPATYAKSGANTDITSRGNNTSTIYTTAGTSTAYTITPTPAITAYAIGQSFFVNFNAACGAAPTLGISAIATPPNLVKENPDGTFSNLAANDIPINHRSRVTLISTTQALVETMPRVIASATTQASTSGTSIDFTGIPSGVKRITIMLAGVSTNGSSRLQIQAGNGSVETSGYLGSSAYFTDTGSVVAATLTSGFAVDNNISTATIRHGALVLTHMGSNQWSYTGNLGFSNGSTTINAGGSKTFSGVIDRIRLTTVSGADTFDAGAVNILYE